MKSLKKNHKIAMICLKYIPVIMFLLMWLYMICSVFGLELIIADSIVGCSLLPSLLIFSLSEVFQFCWLHKFLTGYSLVSDILINWNRYIGLGAMAIPLKFLLVIAGIFIFCALIIKPRITKLKQQQLDN